ncbi:hypothetical protein [Streptomyces sp. NPDC021212]|uniref:hypothetical protein n=1 Tax=Streptomyces sp. NPDC021212 TaxID=3365118 RepID=UPI00379E1186
MAHTDTGTDTGGSGRDHGRDCGKPTAIRALRREVPSVVALLAVEEDFTAMRRYASFGFDDHARYLRRMEGLLRALSSQGVHTTVALFDPIAYQEYCAHTRLDPDTPVSRSRYTAEVASTGATVVYEGQPIDQLLPRLITVAEERATWEYASAVLARAGGCGGLDDCGDGTGRAAFDRATAALHAVLDAAGPGLHHLVCSVPVDDTPLAAVVHATAREGRPPRLAEPGALVFRTVLACGIATGSPGGIVLRTSLPGAPDTVRGWALRDGWPRPLSEAEVFTAYCTDARTGEPIPPEHGVEYRAGLPLPRPEEG